MNFDTLLLIESNRSVRDLSEHYERRLIAESPDILYHASDLSSALDVPMNEAERVISDLDDHGYSKQLTEIMKTRVDKDGNIRYTAAYKKQMADTSDIAPVNALSRMLEKRQKMFERERNKIKDEPKDPYNGEWFSK